MIELPVTTTIEHMDANIQLCISISQSICVCMCLCVCVSACSPLFFV